MNMGVGAGTGMFPNQFLGSHLMPGSVTLSHARVHPEQCSVLDARGSARCTSP